MTHSNSKRLVPYRKAFEGLWDGRCKYCGHWTSKFGLGLIVVVRDYKNGKPRRPIYAYCNECDKIHHPGGYTANMQNVFLGVDRVPYVPTESESEWQRYWSIDKAFGQRKTVW